MKLGKVLKMKRINEERKRIMRIVEEVEDNIGEEKKIKEIDIKEIMEKCLIEELKNELKNRMKI